MPRVNPNYGAGVGGADYEPTTIEELGSMIGKVAQSVIRENSTENYLSVFDKGFVKDGDTIEQAVILLAESQAYDKDGTHTLDRETSQKFAVKYFKSWTQKTFKKTIDISELRKVLNGQEDAENVSTKIVSSMTEGDKQEQYEDIRNMLPWGKQVADGGTGAVLVKAAEIAYDNVNDSIDYDKVLIAMKDTISGMKFTNTSFNIAGIKRRTKPEDIYLLMPYSLKNRIDVSKLAGLFNLEKAEIESKIIETDATVDNGYYYIYIVDKWAVLDYTRLYQMLNQLNAEGRFWNYYLHTDRLYGLSGLFDACYIKIAASAPQSQGE